MTRWMRRIHKWVGLLIGIQFVLWLGSGLIMSLLDPEQVQGNTYRVQEPVTPPWPRDALPASAVLASAAREGGGNAIQQISSGWLLGRPVYQAFDGEKTRLTDALAGTPIAIDAPLASRLAQASYSGPGKAQAPRLLERAGEVRDHQGRLWRVDFEDGQDTTVYLSAQTGQVLEHRNRTWRLFDVVWMLHIMDYAGRKNFNNPLVITAGIGGLWLALTGIWLLITSFRISEFIPARWRGTRELAVFSPDGTALRTMEIASGDTVFLGLARHGLQLPSNCGGGQSCGLCEVRLRGKATAATGADREHLSESKLKMGYRLACNLSVDEDLQVEVVGGASLWTEHEATVESAKAITPFLREIVLRPAVAPGPDYQPGSYLQIHVPGYSMPRHGIAHPEHHSKDWAELDLPETLSNKEAVRRSYSLSLPIEKSGGRLTLLARFSPGGAVRKRHAPGKGSTYLYSLKAGDKLRFSGPFGDFALKPGGREKVFIGGGAGMAPLRAMIHASLEGGASERIHYWYGARNLREAPYIDEMSALADRYPNFTWHLVLSEEAECGAGLLKGLVHEAAHETLLRDHPDIHACDFYLCGPPPMLTATRQMLRRMGVSEDRIAFDDFKV